MNTFETSSVRHGTQSGWKLHQKIGERPCDPCYQAKQEYDKRRLSAPEHQRLNRLLAQAQGRAQTRLKNLFPDIYAVLYAEEKAELLEALEADT